MIDGISSMALEKITRYGLSNSSTMTTFFTAYELVLFQKYDWTTSCDIFYIFMFYILYRVKCNLLNSINTQLLTDSIYQITDKIIDLHSMFESIMSLFPFLTISHLFFAVSQSFYFIRFNNATISIWLLIQIILQISSSLSLVFITNYLSSKLKDGARNICKRINSDPRLGVNTKSALTSAIEKSIKEPTKGWGVFSIDLSLILSFMSSHITFTLLFLQDE